MIIWRLCRRRYAGRPLDGEGARLYGGRWNFPGTPSALIPEEYNYLVNPAHSAVTRLKVGEPRPFVFDPRLFSFRSQS